jgi:hypothetical protein
MGLDSPNQLDPVQQISRYAQRRISPTGNPDRVIPRCAIARRYNRAQQKQLPQSSRSALWQRVIKGQWLREVAFIVVGSTPSGCGRMNDPKFGWAGIQRGTFLFCATLKQRKCLFVIRRIVRFEQVLNFSIAFLGDAHLTKSRYVESHRPADHARHCLLLVGLSDVGENEHYCHETSRDTHTRKGFQFSHRHIRRHKSRPTRQVGAGSVWGNVPPPHINGNLMGSADCEPTFTLVPGRPRHTLQLRRPQLLPPRWGRFFHNTAQWRIVDGASAPDPE